MMAQTIFISYVLVTARSLELQLVANLADSVQY